MTRNSLTDAEVTKLVALVTRLMNGILDLSLVDNVCDRQRIAQQLLQDISDTSRALSH